MIKNSQSQSEKLICYCKNYSCKVLRLTNTHLYFCFYLPQEAIESKYQVPSSQLRIYVHYQPSYYHFHVHFTHLSFDAPGSRAEKAHLLQDVIDNIENVEPAFYQDKTLPCVLKEKDQLLKLFQEAGRV